MKLSDETWYIVRNTRGVTGFVGSGTDPIPLTDEEIRNMGFEDVPVNIDYDNECVKASESLNKKLYCGEIVTNIEEVGEVDLYDVEVSNEGHYYYIMIDEFSIKES